VDRDLRGAMLTNAAEGASILPLGGSRPPRRDVN